MSGDDSDIYDTVRDDDDHNVNNDVNNNVADNIILMLRMI